MNKQELIDKAVEQFCGKYPAKYPENIILSYRDGCEKRRNSYYPFYVCHTESKYDICTKDEFTQRARELGWINGYKWGIEYETNGKKPDLPNDIRVEFFGVKGEWRKPDAVINWSWELSKKFRMVDKRYKPVESAASNEVEQVQDDWYDYEQQKAIALPPVGSTVLFDEYLNDKWQKVQIRGFWTENGNTSVWIHSVGIPNIISDKFRPLNWNRKADEERQKFVELASRIMHQSQCGVINDISLGELYEAGCRFTENKAAS